MTTSSHGKKALKIACAVAGALVIVAGVSAAAYCDNNLHAEERLIARALDAGFQEKQATVDGIDQEAMLGQIACPVVYLKASTNYGDDGVLYAATTDEDAARIQATVPNCKTIEIESGHDIHYEHPSVFVKAIDQAAANAALA